MGLFQIGFDPASLSEIARFYGFKACLSEEMSSAMQEAGELLEKAAQDNTDRVFENPTGELKSTIQAILDSPYEVQIGSNSPYARRREYGFSGMTDSLGRYFASDPARPYMKPALD